MACQSVRANRSAWNMHRIPTVMSCKGSLAAARRAVWSPTSCMNVRSRPAQRSVVVNWTRKEYEENEYVQSVFARMPRKRKLPTEDEVPYKVLQPLTDENGRKSWAMDELWEHYPDGTVPKQHQGDTFEHPQQQQQPQSASTAAGKAALFLKLAELHQSDVAGSSGGSNSNASAVHEWLAGLSGAELCDLHFDLVAARQTVASEVNRRLNC